MAVSLSKEESLQKIDLHKKTFVSLTKSNPILSNLTSRVAVVLDYSYSMDQPYVSGKVQELLERIIPIALQFDDDGTLDVWIFENQAHRITPMTLDNFYGYVHDEIIKKWRMGGTDYAPAINDVVKKYAHEEPSQCPAYVLFITDGECSDRKETYKALIDASQYPIFFQFIGIGDAKFFTLQKLDNLEGRVRDNANFFSTKALYNMSDSDLYQNLMAEYPQFLTLIQPTQGGNQFMAVSLSKGGKVSLAKVASDAGISSLTKVGVGLGWDTNRYDGGAQFDLDAAAFMLGASGKVTKDSDFIFYNNTKGPGVQHMGDNRTGDGDGDDETINIDLTAIPGEITKIAFTVTIDQAAERKQNFGMVENAFIRVYDQNTGTELIRYDLTEDFSIETAIVVAELYNNNGEWKFNAIGSGFQGGLAALCQNFGVNV